MYFIFKEEYKGNFYPLINFLRELCVWIGLSKNDFR